MSGWVSAGRQFVVTTAGACSDYPPEPRHDARTKSGLRKIRHKVSLDFAKVDWTRQTLSRPVEDCEGCPALARIRSLGLDDPSAGRPDLHCNSGDRRIRAAAAGEPALELLVATSRSRLAVKTGRTVSMRYASTAPAASISETRPSSISPNCSSRRPPPPGKRAPADASPSLNLRPGPSRNRCVA
jgi:hypothetical protein